MAQRGNELIETRFSGVKIKLCTLQTYYFNEQDSKMLPTTIAKYGNRLTSSPINRKLICDARLAFFIYKVRERAKGRGGSNPWDLTPFIFFFSFEQWK